jgi:hypothetical protein
MSGGRAARLMPVSRFASWKVYGTFTAMLNSRPSFSSGKTCKLCLKVVICSDIMYSAGATILCYVSRYIRVYFLKLLLPICHGGFPVIVLLDVLVVCPCSLHTRAHSLSYNYASMKVYFWRFPFTFCPTGFLEFVLRVY